MQTHSSDSQLATTTTTTIQKAWHLLSLLLSAGGPTTPLQLASICSLFEATPDLIRFLCSIPNSPITLTSNRSKSDDVFVTVSAVGFLALKDFLSNFNFVDSFLTRVGLSVCRPKLRVVDDVTVYFRKRKRIASESRVDATGMAISPLPKRVRNNCSKFYVTEDMSRFRNGWPVQLLLTLNDQFMIHDLFVKAISTKSKFNIIQMTDEMYTSMLVPRAEQRRITPCEHIEESVLFNWIVDNQATQDEDKVEEMDLNNKTDISPIAASPRNCANEDDACCATNDCYVDAMRIVCKEKDNLVDSALPQREAENLNQQVHTDSLYLSQDTYYNRSSKLKILDIERTTNHPSNQATVSRKLSVSKKLLSKPSSMVKIESNNRMNSGGHPVQNNTQRKDIYFFKESQKHARAQTTVSMAQRSKQKNLNRYTKGQSKDAPFVTPKDSVESKDLPYFESYIVEEEEGSGGYGTVYRARRKNDDAIVAIKCPHADAHSHHVNNEQRMLERFGGKNFIIKYEGCLKSGELDCFVLEHVAHDRPEVLKREIDVFHLRWYGYCMFRALASLHKHGIAHRDVKPGNFLFSCKLNKGYLIDFNLALDLHQRYGTTRNLNAVNHSSNNIALPKAKSITLTNTGRLSCAKPSNIANKEATRHSKPNLDAKSLKKKMAKDTTPHSGWSVRQSQGAEGSGITSVKDGTSGRTPSAERKREPLPCQGRKELLNLVQEVIQSQNHEAVSIPVSLRKRISAPPGKFDKMLVYPTPMPFHSIKAGVVGGAGLTRNKGDGKHKKEGPCVGTKGFRAPEVLFRSVHQGLKVDIWSAGVTLLYFMIGRTPFYGDPEQNIRDIVKLRGSEDLWEVSKLHDRESSFPADLYDAQTLPSITLYEWCKINTKRRDFFEEIPSSLVDLVDKCLTVNPRLRISAEDALKHEFFAPCLEDIRKQRLPGQDSSCGPRKECYTSPHQQA